MSDDPDTPHSFQEIAVARVEVNGPIINMIQFKRHFEEHIVGLRNLGCVPDAKKAIRNLRSLVCIVVRRGNLNEREVHS